ncbi:glycosyltransferase family 92 protein [Cinnamomum micranthum f. kanehirae]|uniref:Glycosyltransferase family 92 protein n=1 Tax=Cinnamomum micranthum f. kanehirae TaxID=337451 RepID=A0A3S4N2W6_9MAGN|nr:glycosyltransferase family 92 protein [Cinnamomum micranthum f. kanehirae]
MKFRRKRDLLSWNRFFLCALVISISCALLSSFSLSAFRRLGVSFRPVLISSGRNPALNAVNSEYSVADRKILRRPAVQIQETVVFPDQVLIFLKHRSNVPLFTKKDLQCIYFPPGSTQPQLDLPPFSIDGQDHPNIQIVRCPIPPRGFIPTVARLGQRPLPARPARAWDSIAYEALIDGDNTTVVFIKGLNLRPERAADPSRFECVYGWNFTRPRFLLSSVALSVAQEIVRCKTPLILLKHPQKLSTIKVTVRPKGKKRAFNSLARPEFRPEPNPPAGWPKPHAMCSCTMVRNQARFIREWVMYHAQLGVDRWFIYDNNSDDEIDEIVDSLGELNFNVSRHRWPWIKTQEAGFAHCALRARGVCEWVGFFDVDEFLYLPSNLTLQDVLRNHSGLPWVGELRTTCHSFGPSGLRKAPQEGVTVGYTCRMGVPERHKSIVKPEALNSTLINVVHHFHLKEGFKYVNMDRGVMVINHYKYQVWEVFKEKFYRRVATYVADWQDEENTGSKDRAPGLGTKAIEPPDWSSRFCDVTDNGLRDWVLKTFMDPNTKLLPWQDGLETSHTSTQIIR